MGWIALAFFGAVGVLTLSMYGMTRWASGYVQKLVEQRLDALREVAEEEKVPAAWSAPFQARIAKQQQRGVNGAQIARTQQRARQYCLRQLDELIKYIQDVKFADAQATQKPLLEKLREQKTRWSAATWEAMMEMHASHDEAPAE